MFKEYQHLDLPAFEIEILKQWQDEKVFEKSVSERPETKPFIFFEGPPSANGMPGIHHVMARTVKDIFCRYKTMQGFKVVRKGGWDTHGLPVELQVEKELGIRKDDIGKTISISDYNQKCRETVMRYKKAWDDLTHRIGFWVDLDNPYITYENEYIESLWAVLKKLYTKGLLYKGYTIQPYSPAAGTGLSSHELNQPGTYKMVKDQTLVALFEASNESQKKFEKYIGPLPLYFTAWTTTPWTLPSNTGLAVGKKIQYQLIKTLHPFQGHEIVVVIALDRTSAYFHMDAQVEKGQSLQSGDTKHQPWSVLYQCSGEELSNLSYHQLLPYAKPAEGNPFRVVTADFVTTEDGTGIVHIAPSFGADDFKTGKTNQLGQLTLVNKEGKFTDEVNDPLFPLQGRFVKESYLTEEEKAKELENQKIALKEIIPNLNKYLSVDDLIALKLKLEGKVFKMEKYEHTYPHCWRTDKPILYYPLDSWFIKTTELKDRMVELNKTINWKPASTGTGRFGNWLENLQDWNLSRSRFWGTPLPIWRTEDGMEELCVGSIDELLENAQRAKSAGYNQHIQFSNLDLHRPFVDEVVLLSPSGKPMFREPDLIDVWFDSGAMPYAQHHWPFENENLTLQFPADFIAEGVDQTRGWFFTLHALSVMLHDSVAYKNVVSNGLVLDKFGNKMSKRLGNVVIPSDMIDMYGVDSLRWYFISNSEPWDNLKFDSEGVAEVQRKLFSTLFNVYGFFALYANIDGFKNQETEVPINQRSELDQWILSLLNSLIKEVNQSLEQYMPTQAARAIQEFVTENLSNWYVRLSRRRFWKGEYTEEKIAAYQTLYTCLETVSKLMAPISPFYADRLYMDLTGGDSVHLSYFPEAREPWINSDLERRMELAQRASSLVLSIRKKSGIKVRQPLQKVIIPALSTQQKLDMEQMASLISAEVNVKFVEVVTDAGDMIKKKVKPNFRVLGTKAGQKMKVLALQIQNLNADQIRELESHNRIDLDLDGEKFELELADVEILSEDVPGWQVASDRNLTVALDIHLTPELEKEGKARELVNRIQNQRKDLGFEVTDRICVFIEEHEMLRHVVNEFKDYICEETLADKIDFKNEILNAQDVELEDIKTKIYLEISPN